MPTASSRCCWRLSPILPKHLIDPKTFEQSGLAPMIGSGPYVIDTVKPGEKIVYKRNPDYWGKNIPAMRGLANYDRVTVNYYLQDQTLFEAFKKGDVDLYADAVRLTGAIPTISRPSAMGRSCARNSSRSCHPACSDSSSIRGGHCFRISAFARRSRSPSISNGSTAISSARCMTARRASGRTPTCRAMAGLQVRRSCSDGDDMKKAMEPAFIDGSYKLPVTDGSGRDRKVLRHAVDLLKAAGYTIRNGRMVDVHGRQLAFEIMTQNPDQEKIALAYQRFLTALGVDAAVRTVDDSSYQQRSQSFDYDVILKSFPSSLSPGIEQVGRWGSQSRDIKGTDSFAGVADPGIDRILNAIVSARGQEDFVTAVRALDRVLMSRYYVVPLYPHRPAMGGASQEPDAPAGDAALWLLAAHLVGWHRPGAIKSKLETDCFLVLYILG